MTTTSACRSTNRPNNSALLISLRTRSIQTRPTRSGLAGIHENRRGMFEVVPDRLDERRPHVTIDYAVVEGARQVHHFPNRDLVVSDDRPLLDLVHPEDGDLGPVDDRRGEDAAFLAERGDREGGPLDVLQGEFLVPRRGREPVDFFREVPEAFLVGLVDNGDREALVRGRRDADVVVSLDDDLPSLVVDGGVQGREFYQRREDGLGEEREEGEFDSLALRGGFQMVAQVNELGHVDLFHIREVSRGGVRFRHLLEDPLPQPMNRDPLFAGGGRDCSGRYGHRGGDSRGGLSGLADVIFGEATLRATASDCREIHVEFLREAADGGCREDVPGRGGRRGRDGHERWRWSRGRPGRLWSGRGRLGRFAEHDERVADLDDLALFRPELEDLTRDGRRDLNGDLVRHDLDDWVVLLDGVPFLHEGEVVKWFVKEGDAVKENDPIVEVMTDKVTVQIPSPVTGKILQLRAKEGEVVKVGNTLVVFGEAGETAPPRPETTRPASAPPPPVMTAAPPAPGPSGEVLAAPAVRRLAKELNVNLAAIRGSGPQGRLTEDDVRKAILAALVEFPTLNSSVDDERGEIVVKRYDNIGIATATDEGLTVTVVHEADKKSLWDLAKEIDRLAGAARDKKLSLQDVQGSTFTITSLGKEGGILATPIINWPEVAILGIHKIEKRPVVRNDQIVIRDMMYLSCSFDHRVVDGHIGAAFVQNVRNNLEHPALLFVGLA